MDRRRRARIVASMLPADFVRLGEECPTREKGGADRIRRTVGEGRFTPDATLHADVSAAARGEQGKPQIAAARCRVEQRRLDPDVAVGGGIGPATVGGPAVSEADVFCAGSVPFTRPGGRAAAVAENLRRAEETLR